MSTFTPTLLRRLLGSLAIVTTVAGTSHAQMAPCCEPCFEDCRDLAMKVYEQYGQFMANFALMECLEDC